MKPRSEKSLTIRMTEEEKSWLERQADVQQINLTDIVCRSCTKAGVRRRISARTAFMGASSCNRGPLTVLRNGFDSDGLM